MKPFIRQEDAVNRLNNTICYYEDKPVLVSVSMDFPTNTIHVTDAMAVSMGTNRTNHTKVISVTDSAFDPMPRSLGYVNMRDEALYIGRMPERRPKQGLASDAITILNESRHGYVRGDLWMRSEFVDMLNNVYPPFKQALKSIQDNANLTSVAFHRDCALARLDNRGSLFLEYRGRMVAIYSSRTGMFSFIPDIKDESYLRLALQRIGVDI